MHGSASRAIRVGPKPAEASIHGIDKHPKCLFAESLEFGNSEWTNGDQTSHDRSSASAIGSETSGNSVDSVVGKGRDAYTATACAETCSHEACKSSSRAETESARRHTPIAWPSPTHRASKSRSTGLACRWPF